jgi:hypothetical protein
MLPHINLHLIWCICFFNLCLPPNQILKNMKRKLILIVITVLMAFGLNAQVKEDNLRSGQIVPIHFTRTVCSSGNDIVRAFVSRDVYGDSGKIVIRGGEPVIINMKKKKGRGWGKAGFVKVDAVSVLSVDGQEITLNGSDYVEGENRKGTAMLVAVGGFFIVPFFGILAGAFVKGEDVCTNTIPVVRVNMSTKIRIN